MRLDFTVLDDDDNKAPAVIIIRGFPAQAASSLSPMGNMLEKFQDSPGEAKANREAFFTQVGWDISRQVRLTPQFGKEVLEIGLTHAGKKVRCDGIFTTDQSLVLTILAADTFPVLVTDRSGSFLLLISGSIWSVDKGVVENAVQLVRSRLSIKSTQLEVLFGPGICHRCYVSDVHATHADSFERMALWRPFIKDDPRRIDLGGFIAKRFVEEGVPLEQIHDTELCTWHKVLVEGSGHSFFSQLRTKRLGEQTGGEDGRFAFAATLTNNRAVPS